jgi:hypothetical protein
MKINMRLPIALFFALLLAAPLQAQTPVTTSQPPADTLSFLPESEGLVYINIGRIINDAAPRLVPEKELKEFYAGLDQMKAFTNVDLRKVEFLVLGMRFNKPREETTFPIPDAMIAVRGEFDAKALVGMAKMMLGSKLREEVYSNHTLNILKISDLSDGAAKNPFASAISEVAMTAIDGSTIAFGTVGYIKSALDAANGQGRIKPETVNSLLKDPNVLISTSHAPVLAFAKSFGLRMAENPDPNCTTKFGDFNLSLSMGEQDFKIVGSMNADNPFTAGFVKNMINGFLQQGKSLAPDKNAQSMFDQIKIMVEGSEVVVQATIPQEMAKGLLREMFAPKPKAATATSTSTTKTVTGGEDTKITKPKTKTRRTRRRT